MLDGRVAIKLGKILNDHGLFPSYNMLSDICYKLTLPSADEIMVTQGGEQIDGYALEDINLVYETIERQDVYGEALGTCELGRSLSYVYATLFKTDTLEKKHDVWSTKIPTSQGKA